MRQFYAIVSAAAVLAACDSVHAATTYYVATDGSDSNPGTQAAPWKTIGKAANTLVAGDTVNVRCGVYNEIISPINSGKAGAPITYEPDQSAAVTIDGSGFTDPAKLSAVAGLFNLRNKSYVNISGFHFVHSFGNGITVNESSHIKIGDNTFNSDFGWSPIQVWDRGANQNHDIEIYGNYIRRTFLPTPTGSANPYYSWDVFQQDGQPWAEMISVRGGKNLSVHHNTIDYNQLGEGIDFAYGTQDSKIFNNTVRNTTSVAIYVDGSYAADRNARLTGNIDVYNNIVHCPANFAIALANEACREGTTTIDTVNICNNVIYGSRQALAIGCWASWIGTNTAVVKNVKVINNTFYDCNTRGGALIAVNKAFDWDKKHPDVRVSNVIFRNNLLFKGGVVVGTHGGNPIAAADHNGFHSGAAVFGTDAVVGDPLFVGALTGDFHLSAGSPFIDRGSAAGAPATDLDGRKRPQGAGCDIGAYEFHPDQRKSEGVAHP